MFTGISLAASAFAQTAPENMTAAQYVETQMVIIQGVTNMLNVKTIAEGPDEVAEGICQLTAYLEALTANKAQLPAEELTKAQAEAKKKARTHAIGRDFLAAINKTSDNKFYNSQKLAEAIFAFSKALEQL